MISSVVINFAIVSCDEGAIAVFSRFLWKAGLARKIDKSLTYILLAFLPKGGKTFLPIKLCPFLLSLKKVCDGEGE